MKILSGLANGQVLQRVGPRGASALIAGTTTEKGAVTATLLKGKKPVKGWTGRIVGAIDQGNFRAKLTSLPVGGPYRLRLQAGGTRAEIASFFVGDVWILAGQSNMEGVGDMTGAAKPHPLVRAFSMRREWRLATDPLHVLAESPDKCHAGLQCTARHGETIRKNAVKGVGAGVFFAQEMMKRSGGVPQGLICTAHGGTSMQQWSPSRKNLGGDSLYASMLMSVQATGQPVAGVLWYQGESDANPENVAEYTQRMKDLVAASRRDLHQPDLPWLTVQIACFATDLADPRDWNSIREQQRLLPEKIKFLETISAIDLALDDSIHISAKSYPRLARQLAAAADGLVNGKRSGARPPRVRSVRLVAKGAAPVVEVAYDVARGGLRTDGGEPHGFTWVSPEGTPLNMIFKTELAHDTVRMHLSKMPAAGVHLFYGHGFAPICNISDAQGFALPAAGPMVVRNIKPKALTPFVTSWMATPVVPAAKKLNRMGLDEINALGWSEKNFSNDGMVNEHELWQSLSGLGFFRAKLRLSEPMQLEFLMGYDGPFCLWLDGKPFFTDMKGINPCIADERDKTASLAKGLHEIHVGMNLNNGQAWGFFLRFARKDVAPGQVLSGDFVQPAYSL